VTAARTTIVVATRNRSAELARTLSRLRALRPTPPVIVLDNASTDRTAERVAEFPGVQLVRLRRNAGAAARNIGVRLASTPYAAFSDDDSWWAPDALPRAESLLAAYPRLGLLAARTLVGPAALPDPTNELMASSPLGREPDLPGPSVLGFLACSTVVRASAFLEAGGFSSLLHFGAEETLLSYDMAALGWGLCYVDDVCAHHHPSTARSSAAGRRRREQRNNTMIAWMRRPAGVALGATTRLMRSVPGDPGAALALLDAVPRMPLALRARTPLPARLEANIRRLEQTENKEPT
jgi:GT2 family glycosyltransferase